MEGERKLEGVRGKTAAFGLGKKQPRQCSHRGDNMIFNWLKRQACTCPPSPLKLLSWNCRTMGGPYSFRYLKRLVEKVTSNVVFLIETKANSKQMEGVCRMLKFTNFFMVVAKGLA